MPAIFTTDAAINRGLGSSPGDSGGRNTASRPQGNGGGSDSFLILLEDGSGFILLEDGSGFIELEEGP